MSFDSIPVQAARSAAPAFSVGLKTDPEPDRGNETPSPKLAITLFRKTGFGGRPEGGLDQGAR